MTTFEGLPEPNKLTERLVTLGDGGGLPPAAERLVHRRIERFAHMEPERVAIVTRDGELTFRELNARADAVAWQLHELGVGREDIVGISLPRRLDALVAIYGTWKAGAAYLPLDAAQPLPRRRFMLDDTNAKALITAPAWADELAGDTVEVLSWEGDGPAGRQTGTTLGPSLDDLAYVIYTSGSTGNPKGVMIEHRSLAAFVHWGVSTFSPDELARVFAATSYGFDMSLFELTIPFAAGGALILADNFFEIAEAGEHRPTMVNTVPSLMAAALADTTLPDSVRTAVFCGETLPPDVAEKVHRQPGVTRVVNAYGPTEDTVYSTAAEVPAGQPPTCGRPLPGTQVYLLDADLKPVGPGDEGEICLAGAGLARGYLGRADLTRERFVERPLGADGPARLYRTGDLGRWEDDGSLQHLGRLDHQIKLRGVRIEPGEIEAALLRHPEVRQAVAVARERPAGGGRWLVAYVVCHPGADPDTRALREMLRERLPEPMVPSAFVKLDEMPLNPNGKLDRARLPEPSTAVADDSDLEGDELALAELWREVLQCDGLPSPGDDFFELGGDSLLAFKLFDRIADRFGRQLPPSLLVEASTLRLLALWIGASDSVGGRVVAEIHPDGPRVPCFYVQSGAGGILALRNFAGTFGVDQPLYGIQAFRDNEAEAGEVPRVVSTAAECVEIVRQRQPEGPYLIAGHSIGGHIAYELACRLEADGDEVVYLGLLDPAAPHTLRWRGRIVARLRELTGTGPEQRRAGAVRAAVSKVRRRLRGKMQGGPDPETANDPDRPSEWMRNLAAMEKRYRPPHFSGVTTIYRTVEMARYTGSATLGWDHYVRGPVEIRRVPGGHVSLLLEPNVAVVAEKMASDIRAAQQQIPSAEAAV
ncbi:MAG TPA: amino acid adenylation domain-containing protein [Thermoleophilaceae bacterium]|nr:amino acid adenylation domain-containing protein [Thermoleophilaceae bacterium]